jgi:hypothetical protein
MVATHWNKPRERRSCERSGKAIGLWEAPGERQLDSASREQHSTTRCRSSESLGRRSDRHLASAPQICLVKHSYDLGLSKRLLALKVSSLRNRSRHTTLGLGKQCKPVAEPEAFRKSEPGTRAERGSRRPTPALAHADRTRYDPSSPFRFFSSGTASG